MVRGEGRRETREGKGRWEKVGGGEKGEEEWGEESSGGVEGIVGNVRGKGERELWGRNEKERGGEGRKGEGRRGRGEWWRGREERGRGRGEEKWAEGGRRRGGGGRGRGEGGGGEEGEQGDMGKGRREG